MPTDTLATRPTAVAHTTDAPAAESRAAMPAAPRVDLYVHIHKAMRAFMTDTLGRVGRLDVFDAAEMDATLGQLEALLGQCENHLKHENEFVHTAIEARQPGGAGRIAEEHVEHLEAISALREDAARLGAAVEARRPLLALRLYRHLALFVAENFQHMHVEETLHNATLWANYSDAELEAIHNALVASLPPPEMTLVARWMVPAMNPTERAGMLNGIKAGAPPQVFDGLLDTVRPHLDASGWVKLAPAIGIAAQPGLVDLRPAAPR